MSSSRQASMSQASREISDTDRPRPRPREPVLQRLCACCCRAFGHVGRCLPHGQRKKWFRQAGRFRLWANGLPSDLELLLDTDLDRSLEESLCILLCSLAESLAQLASLPTRQAIAEAILHAHSALPAIAAFTDLASLDDQDQSPDVLDATLDDIIDTLDSLFHLVPFLDEVLANATPKLEELTPEPLAPFLPTGALWYRSNILDRYSSISLPLAQTLASLNWGRHERIRAWAAAHQHHHNQPESPTSNEDDTDDDDYASSSGMTGTSWGTKLSSIFSRGGKKGNKSWDTDSDSSSVSTSFSSILGDEGSVEQRARWPEPPVDLYPGAAPFECSICYQTLHNITNRAQWKKHVLHDLRPYSCLDPSCAQKATTFSSRKEWISHDFSQHRYVSLFTCVPACGQIFLDKPSFTYHILSGHLCGMRPPATEEEIEDIIASRERKRSRMGQKTNCPFCDEEMEETRNTVMRHVGRHLEEVALKTLPSEVFERKGDDDEDPESDYEDEAPEGPTLFYSPDEELGESSSGRERKGGPIECPEESDAEYFTRPSTPPPRPPPTVLRHDSATSSHLSFENGSMNSSTSSLSPYGHRRHSRTYSDVVKPRPPLDMQAWPPLESPKPPSSPDPARRRSRSPRPSPSIPKEVSEIGVTGDLEKYMGKSIREGDRKGSRESRHHAKVKSGETVAVPQPMQRGGSGRSASGSNSGGGWRRAGEKFKGAKEDKEVREGQREVYGSL